MSAARSDFDAELAALAWLIELGADEAIGETPVNRYEAAVARKEAPPVVEAVAEAEAEAGEDTAGIVAACPDLGALRAALEAFEGCSLRKGAKSLVFADGNPSARVMIVGEAPGREEDLAGLPFVGASGRLLDLMFGAIGLSRTAGDPEAALYITNVLPWRPPRNREPSQEEIAMMTPFLFRHIELAGPRILVAMGGPAAKTILATSEGITRLRGQWREWRGIRVLPMFHPAYLLRNPVAKREAWADLLKLREALAEG